MSVLPLLILGEVALLVLLIFCMNFILRRQSDHLFTQIIDHVNDRLEQAYDPVLSTTLGVLWEASEEALFVTDADARVIRANQAYLDLWGFASTEEAKSDAWLGMITPEGQKLAEQRVKIIKVEQRHHVFENYTKDGRTLRFILNPMCYGDEFIGYAGVIMDIT